MTKGEFRLTKEWISIIFSGISLIISLIVSWNSWWRSRANISIEQTHNADRSLYFKSIDASLKDFNPETRPIFKSVLLIEVILTNKSSLPISILEFIIDDFPTFDLYSYTDDYFEVTWKDNSVVELGKDFPIKYLKPEFTIEPYTSERGYIFFWSGIERDLDINEKILLTVKTSRREFRKKVKVSGKYDSINKNARIIYNPFGERELEHF